LAPVDFVLRDGGQRYNGPFEGTVTVQALPVAGWMVSDIQCAGPDPAAFTIDIAHATVTLRHGRADEQICSFTHRRPPGPGTPAVAPAVGQGIAPALHVAHPQQVVVPRRPLLIDVRAGRGFVVAQVRLTRRAVVKAQLLWRGRLLASARLLRPAGAYETILRLTRATRTMLRHRGLKRVTTTLRVVVVERPGKTYVLRYRVRVRVS
jgi:hypothetical protein